MSQEKIDDSMREPLISVSEHSEETELKSMNLQTTCNAEQEAVYEKMSSVCAISTNDAPEKPTKLEPSLDEMSESSRNSMQSLPLSIDSPALASDSTEWSDMYEPVAVRVKTLESILAESPVYEPTTIPRDKSPAKVPRPDSKSSWRGSRPSSTVSSPVTANIGSPRKYGSPAGAGNRSSASITSGILFPGSKVDPKFSEYQNDLRRKGMKVRSSPLYVNSPIFSPRRASEGSKRSSLEDVKRKALEEADSIDIDQDYNESRKISSSNFLKKKEKTKRVMARSAWQYIRGGSRALKEKFIYDRENNPHHYVKIIGVVIIFLIIIFAIVISISLSYIRKRPSYEVVYKNENFEVRSLKLAMPDFVSLGQPFKISCFLGIVFLRPPQNDRNDGPSNNNKPSSVADKEPVLATAVSHLLIKLTLPTGSEVVIAESAPSPKPVLNHRPGFGVDGTSLSQTRNKAELVAQFNRSSCLDQGSYTCEAIVHLETKDDVRLHSLTKHLQVIECEKKEAVLSKMRPDLKIVPSVINNNSMGGIVSMECSLAERFHPYLVWVDNITISRKSDKFVTIASLTAGENPVSFRNDTVDGSTSLLGKGPHLRFTWTNLREDDFGNYICTQSIHESVTHITTITSPVKSLTTRCPNTEWTYVGSVCLRLYLVNVTWREAERGCASEGGMLFGVTSKAEYGWVKEFLDTQDVGRYLWVGAINLEVKNKAELRENFIHTRKDSTSTCAAIAPQDNFNLQVNDCEEKNGYVCKHVGM